ncbi:unnamed protein product [Schistosoma margrebowiei]|uniref:Uncharacterized protein n=1 Tax=Schistosoma margrebowiei TaxID=48269 RepID=A0A183LRB9_9TREM|nr:unnamed protein product [Schistosoma margrebowiei]
MKRSISRTGEHGIQWIAKTQLDDLHFTDDLALLSHTQQPTVEENKRDPSGRRNQEESLEVDRTHIEESAQLRHKVNLHIMSSWSKEKRNTKEHNTLRNGDRHEKNEQELDRTGNEDPG